MSTLSTSAPSCSRHSVLRVRPPSAVWCRTTVSSPGSSASVSGLAGGGGHVGHLRRVGDAAVVVPRELVGAERPAGPSSATAARASSRVRSARWRGGMPRRGASKTSGRAVMAPPMVPLPCARVTDAETELTRPEPVLDTVGVGPWPGPWPEDAALRPRAARAPGTGATSSTGTATGRVEAIVADLDTRRHPFHVAIENWRHDLNIGTVVRTANAFLAEAVHIVGQQALEPARRDGHRPLPARPAPRRRRRSWPRGPREAGLPLLAVDNLPGARPLETTPTPAGLRAPVRPGGQRPHGRGARGRRRRPVDRPVRLHPVDQRGGRRRHRHARLDPAARPVRRLSTP